MQSNESKPPDLGEQTLKFRLREYMNRVPYGMYKDTKFAMCTRAGISIRRLEQIAAARPGDAIDAPLGVMVAFAQVLSTALDEKVSADDFLIPEFKTPEELARRFAEEGRLTA